MHLHFNSFLGKFMGYFGLCFLLTIWFATMNEDAHLGSPVWYSVIGHMVWYNLYTAIFCTVVDKFSIFELLSNSIKNVLYSVFIRAKN
ncbi:MAG: hypothetical protein V4591_01580 [Bdellovibrionota bacterium]